MPVGFTWEGRGENVQHGKPSTILTVLVLSPCVVLVWEIRLERILQDTGGYSGLLLNRKILWTPSTDLNFFIISFSMGRYQILRLVSLMQLEEKLIHKLNSNRATK